MRKQALLSLFFLICLFGNAWAGLFTSTTDELRTFLAPEVINIDGYETSTKDLNDFYALRDYKPAWSFHGGEKDAELEEFLSTTTALIMQQGLFPDHYPLELIKKLSTADEQGLRGKLEILVTETLLTLAHDLHGDTPDLSKLYPGWSYTREPADIPKLLNEAISANKLNEFIASLVPPHPAYQALTKLLTEYRTLAEKSGGNWTTIDPGQSIRPASTSTRVTQLRNRLEAEGYISETNQPTQRDYFDAKLEFALKRYQENNGLTADGHAGKNTLGLLNIALQTRIDQILANMERWRHMPENPDTPNQININIPSMTIQIIKDGSSAYQGPVIVGRVDRKTPFVQSTVNSMIINPSWHVPTKIAQKDILPKLKKDPHYLEKLGFVIKGNNDDPHGINIDWDSLSAQKFNMKLRQEPGDQNSLGPIKFNFDNSFAVYMHGTPHQELFEEDERAFSSGCVRLRDPEQIGEILTAHNKSPWDQQRITDGIGNGKTRWVNIENPMPIHITYWTVFVVDGKPNFRKDIYDYDQFLIDTIKKKAL